MSVYALPRTGNANEAHAMKTVRFGLLGLLLGLATAYAQAEEFPVTGNGASGRPGDQVSLKLIYDYGLSFLVYTEDLVIEYPNVLHLVQTASSIDVFGSPMNLVDYVKMLPENREANDYISLTQPGTHRVYRLSFSPLSDPQTRNGLVHLNVAFDVLSAAAPGQYVVSFQESTLSDPNLVEYSYPAAVQSLNVTVLAVPEPKIALMLLPGLAVIMFYARRRAAGRAGSVGRRIGH